MSYPRIYNRYTSMGNKSAGVISADSGLVWSATAINTATSDRFFQLFDRETLPTTGEIPIVTIPVYQNNGYTELDDRIMSESGLPFDEGIAWGFSTSAASYQPASVTDGVISVNWT